MPSRLERFALPPLMLTVALFATACGTTIVKKVPVSANYEGWTDIHQKEADAIKGFRYYMPRPYFAVKKEFPVESETLLVEGTFSPDGNYLTFDVDKKSGLADALGEGSWSVRVPPIEGRPQGDGDGGGDDPAEPAEPEAEDKGSESKATLGGEGGPASVVRIGDLFDIVYLPDFTEQYAVQVKPRLSKATLDMSLGHGWMLESAKIEIDNSAVADFLFDQIGSTLDVLRDAFRLDKGLIAAAGEEEEEEVEEPTEGEPVDGAPQGAGGPQGERDDQRRGIVRVQIRKLAIPGVYPILKPREIKRLKTATAWTEGPLTCQRDSPLLVAGVGVICLESRSEILIERALPAISGQGGSGGPKPAADCKKGLPDKVKMLAEDLNLDSITVEDAKLADTGKLKVEVKKGASEEDRKKLEEALKTQISAVGDEWCGAKTATLPPPG